MVPKCALTANTKLTNAIRDDYPKILKWARQVTKNDHHAAEDLVQDLAVKSLQMTVDASDVTNIDSYLYRCLINAHISKSRRQAQRRESQFDNEVLIDAKQLTTDPRDALLVREQLAEICYFASIRKDSSISASILLLRYFHGYFTAEVVKLLKRPRNSIESRMAKARREIHLSIYHNERPERAGDLNLKRSEKLGLQPGDGFLHDLRAYIFSGKTGRCLTDDQRRKIYTKPNLIPTRQEIAHLVSCERCLESINRLLKIPTLLERHPLDTRGPESAFDFFDHHRTKAAVGPVDHIC